MIWQLIGVGGASEGKEGGREGGRSRMFYRDLVICQNGRWDMELVRLIARGGVLSSNWTLL